MRFRRTLRRIGRDLSAFRNVDAYVVTAVGIALIVVDVLGEVPTSIHLTVMTAALVVLVFRTTTPPIRHVDVNEFLRNRSQFGSFREFIQGGRTLWIYAPSAINILRDPSHITAEVLERGYELIVLLQDPSQGVVIQNLQLQLDIAAVDLRNDILVSCDILRKLKLRRDAKPYNIQFGFLTYNPGFSITIVDAERASGRLIVEFFGYQNEFIGNRMHIEITRQQSEYWFEYWVDQFRAMLGSAAMAASD